MIKQYKIRLQLFRQIVYSAVLLQLLFLRESPEIIWSLFFFVVLTGSLLYYYFKTLLVFCSHKAMWQSQPYIQKLFTFVLKAPQTFKI